MIPQAAVSHNPTKRVGSSSGRLAADQNNRYRNIKSPDLDFFLCLNGGSQSLLRAS
jgi:hypothetical protein